MPLELTGEPNELVFVGEYKEGSSISTLSGVNGTMMCSEGLSKLCNVQFKDLKPARLKIIKGLSGSSAELRERLSVARSFSGDPGKLLIPKGLLYWLVRAPSMRPSFSAS